MWNSSQVLTGLCAAILPRRVAGYVSTFSWAGLGLLAQITLVFPPKTSPGQQSSETLHPASMTLTYSCHRSFLPNSHFSWNLVLSFLVRELSAHVPWVSSIPTSLMGEDLALLSTVVCPWFAYSYTFTEQYQILFIVKYILSSLFLSLKKLLWLFLGISKLRMFCREKRKKQPTNTIMSV